MAQEKLQRMSREEFFDWQRGRDRLYELVDGLPVLPLKMMTGTTRRHDRIVVNAIALFLDGLKGGPCRPWTDAVAVEIPRGNIRRPDVSVDCGELGDGEMVAAAPRLVMEVLSPSTMNFDRIVKLGEYKRVASMRNILLVDTEAPQVTLWRRESEKAQWSEELVQCLDGVLNLAGLEMKLGLDELYEGVVFEAAAG